MSIRNVDFFQKVLQWPEFFFNILPMIFERCSSKSASSIFFFLIFSQRLFVVVFPKLPQWSYFFKNIVFKGSPDLWIFKNIFLTFSCVTNLIYPNLIQPLKIWLVLVLISTLFATMKFVKEFPFQKTTQPCSSIF